MILLIVNSFLLSFTSSAQVMAVKVDSYSTNQALHKEGSGVVWSDSGSTFVLSSDHVVYNANDEYFHQIELKSAPDHPVDMRLARSDFGFGLSLLRTERTIPETPQQLNLCKSDSDFGQTLKMSGFPASTSALKVEIAGNVKRVTIPSRFHPQVGEMLEIQNTTGEFGMSGGALISQSGCLAGILSWQSATDANLIYAIPYDVIEKWLAWSKTANEKFKAKNLFLEPELQNSDVIDGPNQQGLMAVYTGRLFLVRDPHASNRIYAYKAIQRTEEPDHLFGGALKDLEDQVDRTQSPILAPNFSFSTTIYGERTDRDLRAFSLEDLVMDRTNKPDLIVGIRPGQMSQRNQDAVTQMTDSLIQGLSTPNENDSAWLYEWQNAWNDRDSESSAQADRWRFYQSKDFKNLFTRVPNDALKKIATLLDWWSGNLGDDVRKHEQPVAWYSTKEIKVRLDRELKSGDHLNLIRYNGEGGNPQFRVLELTVQLSQDQSAPLTISTFLPGVSSVGNHSWVNYSSTEGIYLDRKDWPTDPTGELDARLFSQTSRISEGDGGFLIQGLPNICLTLDRFSSRNPCMAYDMPFGRFEIPGH